MTLVAMSGGVDSSVSAKLLIDSGCRCIGATMRLCAGSSFSDDALSVCEKLGIRHVLFDFFTEFDNCVVSRFADAYVGGLTPNPCVECNKHIKFGLLYQRAESLGCDYVATGHYARIEEKNGMFLLKKALDSKKDQSYFLYNMTQEILARTVFPLGSMKKEEIRSIAVAAGFSNAEKPDSQDICFIPDGDYASVVRKLRPDSVKKAVFMDGNGKILGENPGVLNYTVGQRRGLNLAMGVPYYVTKIDARNNIVYVGERDETYSSELLVRDVNWISGYEPQADFRCAVRIRYLHRESMASVSRKTDGIYNIRFDEAQYAVTPGQSAVFYDGDTVLGGGIIERAG